MVGKLIAACDKIIRYIHKYCRRDSEIDVYLLVVIRVIPLVVPRVPAVALAEFAVALIQIEGLSSALSSSDTSCWIR